MFFLPFILPIDIFSQYKIERKAVGYGAVNSSNISYTIKGTIGQPVIGNNSNSNQTIKTGYWYIAYSKPKIITNEVSDIFYNKALCGGVLTSNGGRAITERGICWSESPNPSATLTTKAIINTTSGTFSINMSRLNPVTTYYVRAYAINSQGTSYGEQQQFTTTPVTPTLSEWSFIVLLVSAAGFGCRLIWKKLL